MEGNRGAKRPPIAVSPPTPPPPPSKEEDEEEQMEKFYSLLGNIKAMRDLWRTNPANKRPRREEPLWQPRFVREDFSDRNEAAESAKGELDSPSKEGERRKGKEKEREREEGSSLDLSLAL